MLTRTKQNGAKIEATEGTAETLSATHFSGKFKDSSFKYAPGNYERGTQQPGLAKDPSVRTSRTANITIAEEFIGGTVSAEAPWAARLKACGFQVTQLKKVACGSISGGTFRAGDIIGNNATQASSTKTGIFVRVASGTLWYVPVTGTFASADTVYNYATSQVSTTLSGSPANGGWGYTPQTETDASAPASLTMEHRIGGEIHQAVACRGKVTLSMKMGEVPLWNWDFTGVPVTSSDAPASGSAMTSIPAVGGTPLPVKGMPIAINGVTPVLTMVDISIDNALSQRATIANNDFQASGYQGTRITDRNVKVSVDPLYVAGSPLNVVKNALLGTTFPMSIEYGLTSHVNGCLVIGMPVVQQSPDVEQGDRDGEASVSLEMTAFRNAGDDDEIGIYHCF